MQLVPQSNSLIFVESLNFLKGKWQGMIPSFGFRDEMTLTHKWCDSGRSKNEQIRVQRDMQIIFYSILSVLILYRQF